MADLGRRIKRIKNQLKINADWVATHPVDTFQKGFWKLQQLNDEIVSLDLQQVQHDVGYLELMQRRKERTLRTQSLIARSTEGANEESKREDLQRQKLIDAQPSWNAFMAAKKMNDWDNNDIII
jgi:hypothetical protein